MLFGFDVNKYMCDFTVKLVLKVQKTRGEYCHHDRHQVTSCLEHDKYLLLVASQRLLLILIEESTLGPCVS